jgi:hypothetical protein
VLRPDWLQLLPLCKAALEAVPDHASSCVAVFVVFIGWMTVQQTSTLLQMVSLFSVGCS